MNATFDAPDAHAIAVMALTLFALFLFSRPRISLESSGLAIPTLLIVGFKISPYVGASGSLGSADFLAGFGNPALIALSPCSCVNLLVVELAADQGLPRFGMFDFALPVILAGFIGILVLWLIAPWVLPARTPPLTDTSPRIFRGVLHVNAKSAFVGRTLAEVRTLTQGRMQLERIERGNDLFIARLPTTVFRDGDRLYVRGQSWQLKDFETVLGAPLHQSDMASS